MNVYLNSSILPAAENRQDNFSAKTEPLKSMKSMQREDGEEVNLFQKANRCAIVELSEEGRRKLEYAQSEIKIKKPLTDFSRLSEEEQAEIIQKITRQPAHHRIIQNIRTNDKLHKSLEGADQKIKDAADSIIYNNLIPHNVGNLTEEERQEQIYVGIEEAKYLSTRLSGNKADLFMEAIQEIAQYGFNGEMDREGNVTYDIRQGPPVGAPNDTIGYEELMKRTDPKAYEVYKNLRGDGKDLHMVCEALWYSHEWEKKAFKHNRGAINEVKQEQLDWMYKMKDTEIKSPYHDTHKGSIHLFIQNVMTQNRVLNSSYLLKNLKEFADIISYGY